MAVSHSFAGEHVKDGSDEKTDADREQHEIKHSDHLNRVRGKGHAAYAGTAGAGATNVKKPESILLPRVRPFSGTLVAQQPRRDWLTASNAQSSVKIRGASVFVDIRKP